MSHAHAAIHEASLPRDEDAAITFSEQPEVDTNAAPPRQQWHELMTTAPSVYEVNRRLKAESVGIRHRLLSIYEDSCFLRSFAM